MNEIMPMQLSRMDTDRVKGYQALLDFYRGFQWQGRERRRERRLTFNYARVFIDKITSYLMTGISFAVDALEDSPEAAERARRAETALYQVYVDNNLEQLDLETEIDCAILGDACYKVIWDGVEKRSGSPPLTFRAPTPGVWATIPPGCGGWPPATACLPRKPGCSTE